LLSVILLHAVPFAPETTVVYLVCGRVADAALGYAMLANIVHLLSSLFGFIPCILSSSPACFLGEQPAFNIFLFSHLNQRLSWMQGRRHCQRAAHLHPKDLHCAPLRPFCKSHMHHGSICLTDRSSQVWLSLEKKGEATPLFFDRLFALLLFFLLLCFLVCLLLL
jgi:hypothetical protein